jgi:predicted DNA-binding transcriptional regulator AlpA
MANIIKEVVRDTRSVTNIPPISDKLLTVKEVAEIVGLKPGTLNRARITGGDAPPFVKIGSSVRYRYSTVMSWVASKTELSSTSEASAV